MQDVGVALTGATTFCSQLLDCGCFTHGTCPGRVSGVANALTLDCPSSVSTGPTCE